MSSEKMYKDNIEIYLKDLAKEFRRLNGKTMPAEIVIVGGASIVLNYGFRDSTTDIDAIIKSSYVMKDAARIIREKYDLDDEWINDGFSKTSSFSNEIYRCAKYYRTYSGIVRIYTVSGKYLIAMKLMSGRDYKYDLSDIIGILNEHHKVHQDIAFDDIVSAANELYGSYDKLPISSRDFIEGVYSDCDLEMLYYNERQQEIENKTILVEFDKDYNDVLNQDNVHDILKTLKLKQAGERD